MKKTFRQPQVKIAKNIPRRNKNPKGTLKKTWLFCFLFGDLNISNIFYKIQNLKPVVPFLSRNIKLYDSLSFYFKVLSQFQLLSLVKI